VRGIFAIFMKPILNNRGKCIDTTVKMLPVEAVGKIGKLNKISLWQNNYINMTKS
jgi:hypothetical protein